MQAVKELWRERIGAALEALAAEAGLPSPDWRDLLQTETPPKPDMGDLAFPLFPFARIFRKAPPQIAADVAGLAEGPGTARAAGPYVNVFLDRAAVAADVIDAVATRGGAYGRSDERDGQKIMIEFSSPNTNKPLHLGHLRNDALGESVARILDAAGAEVQKINLVNDRGVHICKSMLAYSRFGKGETPEEAGVKGDRLVGDYYVKYAEWAKEDPTAEEQAQQMLRDWEAHEPEVMALWEKMNKWTMDGIGKTYQRTGVTFDRMYYESRTYKLGRDIILEGLERDVFFKAEDGSIRLDLSDEGMDTKVMLRADGTSVYITQDLGTAASRHDDWPFDRMIYVVGNEQEYHFQVLFKALKKLGFAWADNLYHLSYGMVNLPEGKMKSREGTVVDADDLIDSLRDLAAEEIRSKEREEEVDDVQDTAEKIALAALHYFLLQVTPGRDMIFDPKDSLSFNGNTGPYLQYMTSRISSMDRKAEGMGEVFEGGSFDPALLAGDAEWDLVKLLAGWPGAISQAAGDLSPALVASHLYDLARSFSRFYHDNPVLNAGSPDLVVTRMALSRAVLQVLKNGFHLINIPFLDRM